MGKEQCNLWPPLPKNRFLKVSYSILQKTSKQLYLPLLEYNMNYMLMWSCLVTTWILWESITINYHSGLFIITMEYIVIILFSCLVVVTIIFIGSGFENINQGGPWNTSKSMANLVLLFQCYSALKATCSACESSCCVVRVGTSSNHGETKAVWKRPRMVEKWQQQYAWANLVLWRYFTDCLASEDNGDDSKTGEVMMNRPLW